MSRMRKMMRMMGVAAILALLSMTSIGSRGCFSSSTKRVVGSSAPQSPVFYIFGGEDDGGDLDAIVKFDLSSPITVTTLVTPLPSARDYTSAVWDPVNKCAYIFGGYDTTYLDDIVRFEPASITPVTTLSDTNPTAVLPTTRNQTSAVWDPDNKVAYIFGGTPLTNAIVRFEPASITPVTVISETLGSDFVLPSIRYYTSAVWDPVNNVAYVFGGHDGTNFLDDIVKFDPAIPEVTTLSDTNPTAVLPLAMYGTSAVWDPVNKVAYIFGGYDTAIGYLDAIVKFDPAIPEVTTLSVTINSTIVLPSIRYDTSAVWDPVNRCVYIFGGEIDVAPWLTDEIVKFDPGIEAVTVLSETENSGIVLPTERAYFSACPGQ